LFIDLRIGALHEPLSGRRWSSEEVQQLVLRRATRLFDLGVRRGQRVFVHYGNTAEFFVDVLSLWTLGACAVPVDPRFTAYEMDHLARAVAPSHSIWDGAVASDASDVFAALDVRLVDAKDCGERIDPAIVRTGLPMLDDDALLLFTSGTTGKPKGVVHTHRSLRARWNHQHEHLGSAPFARTLCPVATHFAWGLIGNCLFTLLTGQELFLVPAFRQDVLLRLGALCDEHKITCLVSVPMMWRVALKLVAPPKAGSLQRVTCGTSPLSPALWREVQRWSGANEVLNVYGITETGWLAGAALGQLVGDEPLVGTPWGAVIRILEGGQGTDPDQLRICAPGESGYVWAQTAALMKGYFGQDELTRQVVRQGWFCTGDLGYRDERGLLYLRGRDKEQINIGGSKVYPADIDAAAEHIDFVRDVCAFAVDDPLQGEDVAIAVVLREGSEATLAALYRKMAERLAPHQMPRRWYQIEEIVRTARGKLNRSEVAKQCAARTPVLARVLEKTAAGADNPPGAR
jgi:acyl-CoA synthetase (AMP-forming)/AMP-acid ligase II